MMSRIFPADTQTIPASTGGIVINVGGLCNALFADLR
jgi:hypothetical protein